MRRQNLELIHKIRTHYQIDFAILEDHKVKRNQKINKVNKYKDLARNSKNQWTVKMMVIPIVVGALGMVPKGQEKKLRKPKV